MKHINKVSAIVITISIVFVLLIPFILSYSVKDITIWGILVLYSGIILGGLFILIGVVLSIKQIEKEKTRDLE